MQTPETIVFIPSPDKREEQITASYKSVCQDLRYASRYDIYRQGWIDGTNKSIDEDAKAYEQANKDLSEKINARFGPKLLIHLDRLHKLECEETGFEIDRLQFLYGAIATIEFLN